MIERLVDTFYLELYEIALLYDARQSTAFSLGMACQMWWRSCSNLRAYHRDP